MRRLASLSGAEDALLTHIDGGLDFENNAFVMALSTTGGGFTPLAEQLRSRHGALAFPSLRQATQRAAIWEALARLARGIHLMHRQRILHQSVGAENVFGEPAIGPSSWRLGGFEWAFRFGSEVPAAVDTPHWVGVPGALQDGVSFAADWYLFGTLATRIFCNVESLAKLTADQRHPVLLREAENGGASQLQPRERALLLRLLGFRTSDRLIIGEQLIDEIHDIAQGLVSGTLELNPDVPFVLVFNPRNEHIIDACRAKGFDPSGDEITPFNFNDIGHVDALRSFLEEDLRSATLHRKPEGDGAVLCGSQLTWFILPHAERQGGVLEKPSWDFAFLANPSEVTGSDPEEQRDLSGLKILPVPQQLRRGVSRSQPWTAVLLQRQLAVERHLALDLALMHNFVRCTNQLDLLFTSARIFSFEEVSESDLTARPSAGAGKWEELFIREAPRQVDLPSWARSKGGLATILSEEASSGKDRCRQVLLTEHSRLSTGRQPDDEEWWESEVQQDGRTIRLRRPLLPGRILPVLRRGFVRTFGLWGQFSLVERRQRAIDRLKDHRYLLRVLASPICRDSKVFNDHLPIPAWLKSKAAVMEDVERVRPIYALQGPPGTGKTTFESQHLRRVFEEQPEAQVLVTAQAHAAVDVLRRKVRDEAFKDKEEDAKPLSIRLGGRDDVEPDVDSIQSVTRRLLEASRRTMAEIGTLTPQQERWLAFLERATGARGTRAEDALIRAMEQLLKSGAQIVYCTTSASDLAILAESNEFDHSYDLVIVEESGRVHAFDLALPLEAGHRWLLLGDHQQLPPFQIRQFEEALSHLGEAMEALERLGEIDRIDSKWVDIWTAMKPSEKETFQRYALVRLRYFKWLHEHLGGPEGEKATNTEVKGTGAGMLRVQFRMHPHICEVISEAFYKGRLHTDPDTLDGTGNHKREFRHQLTLGGMPPEYDLRDRAIVWIDLPPSSEDRRFLESGQRQRSDWLNYRNLPEARAVRAFIDRLQPAPDWEREHSIAVLTPYRQQIIALQHALRGLATPPFLELVSSLGVRKSDERGQWTHTIDSFQGNEADVIITSLVRNNTETSVPRAIGFLADPERLNVMLSRPKQLLVLVGSWKFFQAQTYLARKGDDAFHLKTVLGILSKSFDEKRAVLIPVARLTSPPIS